MTISLEPLDNPKTSDSMTPHLLGTHHSNSLLRPSFSQDYPLWARCFYKLSKENGGICEGNLLAINTSKTSLNFYHQIQPKNQTPSSSLEQSCMHFSH